jgi:phosphoribosylaminoimidazolecarboxamide formyltransferase/IMP cyclohydrolase
MRALLSASDKTGLVELARSLLQAGFELVSTGGTHRMLTEAGLPALHISDVTGFPELLDGRVRTLHPNIHAGILARRDLPEHSAELSSHGIAPVDLVCVNLYPFVETVSRPGVSLEEAIENIDIGGPTLLRAAAKNFPSVLVLADPVDYERVAGHLVRGEPVSLGQRQELARKAFAHVGCYDAAIASYLGDAEAPELPHELPVGLRKLMDLRYGENPHQKAAFYVPVLGNWGIGAARQLHGKELSYNNILDADAAWRVVLEFDEPAVAVVKHTNPCGLALHDDLAEAYRRAYAGDPVSAFGGIVACNRPLTTAMAEAMKDVFYEIVLAPEFEPEALELLRKKRNLRLLAVGAPRRPDIVSMELRQVSGGLLVQAEDALRETPENWRTATKRAPTAEESRDLLFAWRAARHVKSNAIVLAAGQALIGMGAGQPNRVTSVRLAVDAAGERVSGTVLASDAFFPFPDGVEAAAAAGVTAAVQPGGSIRDQEVIDAADAAGMAMVFTGTRHFRH